MVPSKPQPALAAYRQAAEHLSRIFRVTGLRIKPKMLYYTALRVKWLRDQVTEQAAEASPSPATHPLDECPARRPESRLRQNRGTSGPSWTACQAQRGAPLYSGVVSPQIFRTSRLTWWLYPNSLSYQMYNTTCSACDSVAWLSTTPE
jgi:hypothetical protein